MRVYLDHAASTPVLPLVLEAMTGVLVDTYGNPSSIHSEGRKAKTTIEKARKQICRYLNCAPSSLFFTSGGTEADNWAIKAAVYSGKCKHIISTRIEHHAVLHAIEDLVAHGLASVDWLDVDHKGNIDLDVLDQLLAINPSSLESLMHINNELGNIISLDHVGHLCRKHGAIFHSDTVQSVGIMAMDLQNTPVDFITASAHKFNGPKGVGFLYIHPDVNIPAFIHGGAQERNLRAGTENIAGIIGMTEAFSYAMDHQTEKFQHLTSIKSYMWECLQQAIPGIEVNGDIENSSPSILNILLPPSHKNEMLLYNLDIKGVAASGGSACTSGSNVGSHVLSALQLPEDRAGVRFSFGGQTTKEEIEFAVSVLKDVI
jgi:cysteine desulfurase